ncbi:MAG: fumarylacetoacetate hydrolase family protein [Planctomycetes bacterium]|nr:fumarylacetoacetate hydrolase family protein [Planctomycetota bacterium]
MLTRAIDPEGRAHWLWEAADGVHNLSLAGLPSELAEAARFLASDSESRDARIAQAPLVPTQDGWAPILPGRPGKILCLGRNFPAPAHEMGTKPSLEDLLWFSKFPESCVAPSAPVPVPAWLKGRVDPEAELVLVLREDLHMASEKRAASAIAGWTLGNDLTARGVQASDKEKSWPWVRSKNLVGLGGYGPGWIPADALVGWDELVLEGRVNGELRQAAPLRDMLYSPARALAELSRWLRLEAGDLLFLGTPPGVQPLHDQDLCQVRLLAPDGSLPLGTLTHQILRPHA